MRLALSPVTASAFVRCLLVAFENARSSGVRVVTWRLLMVWSHPLVEVGSVYSSAAAVESESHAHRFGGNRSSICQPLKLIADTH